MSDSGLGFDVSSNPVFTKLIVDILAPRLITTFIQAVELGIVINMSVNFWAHASKERTSVKLMVAFVTVVATFQTCVMMYDMWSIFVVNFLNLSGALAVTWGLKALPLITISMAAPVQAFLAWRCWMLGNRNWFILAPLIVLLLASVATSLRFTVQNFQTDFTALLAESPPEEELPGVATIDALYLTTLVIPAFLDVCLTGLLLVYLLRSRSKVITQRFRKVLSQLAIIVWEAAIPPSIAAVLCIVTFLTFVHKSPLDLLFQGILGQLYVISMFVTLNGFRRVREMEYANNNAHVPSTTLNWRNTWNNTGRDARIEMHVPTERGGTSFYNVAYPPTTSCSSSQSPHLSGTTTGPSAIAHISGHAKNKSVSKSLSSLNVDFTPVKDHDDTFGYSFDDFSRSTKEKESRSSPTLVMTQSDRGTASRREQESSPYTTESYGGLDSPSQTTSAQSREKLTHSSPRGVGVAFGDLESAAAAGFYPPNLNARGEADVPVTPLSPADSTPRTRAHGRF